MTPLVGLALLFAFAVLVAPRLLRWRLRLLRLATARVAERRARED